MGGRPGGAPIDARDGGAGLDRLILDTTVLVSAERRRRRIDQAIGDDDDVAIAAITAAELLVGVELADRRSRARREAFVAELLETVPIEDYSLATARAHAHLLAFARESGRPRGAHDLMIAATAVSSDRIVVTADARGFTDLPSVQVRVV
jgi:tRNA(fMet)-specific endonuclease VapC